MVTFFNNDAIEKFLEKDLNGKNGMKTLDTDRVIVIGGYEGKGKSNLFLNMLETWYTKIIKEPFDETNIVNVPSNINEFAAALVSIKHSKKKFQMVGHDEAAKDMYKREAQKKMNIVLNKAYMVIRGMNIYTALLIPNIMDLDPFFRNRRVTAYLFVYRRGKYAYFSKKTLAKLLPAMNIQMATNSNPDPMSCKDTKGNPILPDFIGSFPKYTGVLLEPYMKRKQSNMESTIEEISNQLEKYKIKEEKEEMMSQKVDKVQLLPAPIIMGAKVEKMMKDNPQMSRADVAIELNKTEMSIGNYIRALNAWRKKNKRQFTQEEEEEIAIHS